MTITRTDIYCWEDGDEYVAEWNGTEVRSGNPFGLDSKLETEAFAPRPRNLHLVGSRDEALEQTATTVQAVIDAMGGQGDA